jgi:hypothetical protein
MSDCDFHKVYTAANLIIIMIFRYAGIDLRSNYLWQVIRKVYALFGFRVDQLFRGRIWDSFVGSLTQQKYRGG